jgi:hypothetical protein
MNFKDAMAADASVFFNEEEFAVIASVSGKEIPVIIDRFESDVGFIFQISFETSKANVLGISLISKGTRILAEGAEYVVISEPREEHGTTLCDTEKL